MKTLPVFTSAAVVGLLAYLLYKKKGKSFTEQSSDDKSPAAGEHHLTNVFAKAKQYATE